MCAIIYIRATTELEDVLKCIEKQPYMASMLALQVGIVFEVADMKIPHHRYFTLFCQHALHIEPSLCCSACLPCLEASVLETSCAVSECTEVVAPSLVGFQRINTWLFAVLHSAATDSTLLDGLHVTC